MMPISTSMKQGLTIRTPTSKFFLKSGGFTLIEIMVALTLVALIVTLTIPSGTSPRQQLDETLTHLERAIRFGVDEATIRNVIVRIHFMMNEDPQQFRIEYGPDAQYIPPPRPVEDLSSLGLSEREEFLKQQEETNQKFNRIRELAEGKFEVMETILINGVGHIESENLMTEGEASLYIYPTGEKDHALIILSSDDEYVTLEVEPYSLYFERNYILHGHYMDLESRYEDAKEFFQSWRQAQ